MLCGLRNCNVKVWGGTLQPKWLWIELTDRCNSRCIFCNVWKKTPTKDPLSPEEIYNTLKQQLFRKVGYIINSGGEPSLRNDLKQLLEAEHSALPDARLQFSTNGLVVDRISNLVDFVENELKCGLDVGVSLDGVGESHDKIRGVRGNFEKVHRLLNELILRKQSGYDLNISIGSTLTNETVGNADQIKAYAQQQNINFMLHWFNQSDFYDNIDEKATEDVVAYERAIKTVLEPSPYREMWLNYLEGKAIRFNCFALQTFCVIKCNGDISPCLSRWNDTIGNVREKSASDIWRSKEAHLARKKIDNCKGCLNSWGVGWSLQSSYYPLILFSFYKNGGTND